MTTTSRPRMSPSSVYERSCPNISAIGSPERALQRVVDRNQPGHAGDLKKACYPRGEYQVEVDPPTDQLLQGQQEHSLAGGVFSLAPRQIEDYPDALGGDRRQLGSQALR